MIELHFLAKVRQSHRVVFILFIRQADFECFTQNFAILYKN